MNFSQLSRRDQIVLAGFLLFIIALFYGLVRYRPASHALQKTQAEIVEKQDKIKAVKFPDTPKRSVEDIQRELDAGVKEIANLQTSLDAMQSSFSDDAQDLQIRISDLARNLGIRIRDRRPYGASTTGLPPIADGGGGALTSAEKKDRRIAKIRERRLAREAAAKGVAAAKPTQPAKPGEIPIEELVNPPAGGLHDLITLLSTEGKAKRPLQQLIIETDFRGLQRFISELEKLPSFITVVQMDISITGKDSPQGLPQPLTARLVISQ